jgi:hypothetical protein
MHLAVLTPTQAMNATLLLGTPTVSYQSPGSTFCKLFATHSTFTMTGIVLEATANNCEQLALVEERLLQTLHHTDRRNKRPSPSMRDQTLVHVKANSGWSARQNMAILVRIVGVWDATDEFGLVCKYTLATPPRSPRCGLLARIGDHGDPREREPDTKPEEGDGQDSE